MVHYGAASDARGEYHILGLPAGQFTLTVEQPGFRTYRQSGITLRLGDRTRLEVKLSLGEPSETIEVTAAAPLLQTASGEVSLNVDQQKITTLPLDGRNFIPLVTLSPGVALPNGQFLPRINGSRPRTNEYLYDGISVLQPEPGQVVYYPDRRRHGRVQTQHQRLLSRVRPVERRHGDGDRKIGKQPVPRRRLRVFPQRSLERAQPVRATGPETRVPPQPIWADRGRTDSNQQDLLLRGLAGDAAAHRHYAIQRGSHTRAAAGNLYPADLRSGQLAAHAVREQHDSGDAFRHAGEPGAAALSAAERRRREQFCADRDRARQSGSGRLPHRPLLRRKAPHLRTLHFLPRRRYAGHAAAGWKRKSDVRSDRACDAPAATRSLATTTG